MDEREPWHAVAEWQTHCFGNLNTRCALASCAKDRVAFQSAGQVVCRRRDMKFVESGCKSLWQLVIVTAYLWTTSVWYLT